MCSWSCLGHDIYAVFDNFERIFCTTSSSDIKARRFLFDCYMMLLGGFVGSEEQLLRFFVHVDFPCLNVTP